MPFLRKIVGTAGVVAVAAGVVNLAEITSHYPPVDAASLPRKMQIVRVMEEKAATKRFAADGRRYIAYCDTFTARVPGALVPPAGTQISSATPDSAPAVRAALADVLVRFFAAPVLQLQNTLYGHTGAMFVPPPDADDVLAPGTAVGRMFRVDSTTDNSVLVRWDMPEATVGFFDSLAGYGYPWRLMTGGYHEIYAERVPGTTGTVRLWFASAHEYAAHRDGKTIPQWVLGLHRIYARIILRSAIASIEGRA
ncbi:uncharacterized protein V1510DRAFT_422415 [Dipodascopsis tothii]|uniref:uncharacterized protein n=1 Tax=Dipodascopsis tothii TaxID=44089 RepID=UPI0034CD08E3